MSDPAEEWLTVADAARRLGVSERTARRHAGRLPDSDRQTPDSGPVRVRLSSLRERVTAGQAPDTVTATAGQGDGQTPDSAGQVADTERDLLREIIERQDRDILSRDRQISALYDALREAQRLHDQAQQLHGKEAMELRDLRRKAEALEAENRELRAIQAKDPGPPVEVTLADVPPVAPVAVPDAPAPADGSERQPAPETTAEVKRRAWWQRLWGRD